MNISSNYSLPNDFGAAYYYAYIHPVAALFASFQSILCSIVMAQKELQKNTYFHFSLANSISAAVGTFLAAFLAISRCNYLCTFSWTYWAQTYEIYAIFIVCASLLFASALFQIAISLKLYLIITRKMSRLNSYSSYKIIFISLGKLSINSN